MDNDYFDQPPYSMIGVQTTIYGRCRKPAVKRPIGFIWPKQAKAKKAKKAKRNG